MEQAARPQGAVCWEKKRRGTYVLFLSPEPYKRLHLFWQDILFMVFSNSPCRKTPKNTPNKTSSLCLSFARALAAPLADKGQGRQRAHDMAAPPQGAAGRRQPRHPCAMAANRMRPLVYGLSGKPDRQGEAGSGLGRCPLPCQCGSGAIAPVCVGKLNGQQASMASTSQLVFAGVIKDCKYSPVLFLRLKKRPV
jgi:hypothetical protein